MQALISYKSSPRIIKEMIRPLVGSAVSCKNKSPDDIELPPEPTNCCMSGCPNCVWIVYAEELLKLFQGNSDKVQEVILTKIKDPTMRAFVQMELQSLNNRMADTAKLDKDKDKK